jgi:hypothetical protein
MFAKFTSITATITKTWLAMNLLSVTEVRFKNKCLVFFAEPHFGTNKPISFIANFIEGKMTPPNFSIG